MPFEVLLLLLFLTSSPSFNSSGVVNVVSTALPLTLLVARPVPNGLQLGLIHDWQERCKQLLRFIYCPSASYPCNVRDPFNGQNFGSRHREMPV